MYQYLVLLGALVTLVGCLSYVRATLRGNTRPNRVSWLMWSVAPIIASIAAITGGVTWAALPVFMSGFGPLLIFLSTFSNRSAYWQLSTLDYLCGFFSLVALVSWALTRDPAIAISFAILSDALAAFPTVKKALRHANTETYGPYIGGLFSVCTGFFAVHVWSFVSTAFLFYLVLINLVLIFSISYGNRRSLASTKQIHHI